MLNKHQSTDNSNSLVSNQPLDISTQWKKREPKAAPNYGVSLTVPGQSQSLKDLMSQYIVGIPTTGYHPIFSENPELDLGINPKTLDYVDIQNMSNANLKKINQLNTEYQNTLAQAKQDASDQQMEEFEEKLRLKIQLERNENIT